MKLDCGYVGTVGSESFEITYSNPFDYFKRFADGNGRVSFLLESRSKNLAYGRQSVVVPSAALSVTGKNEEFCLEALTDTGREILKFFGKEDFEYAEGVRFEDGKISGRVQRGDLKNLNEDERIHSPNTSFAIRTVLNKFKGFSDEHAGLYGAFAYDFARNFESFGDRFAGGGGPDFKLYLPSTVVFFDDIRERTVVKRFSFNGKNDGLEESVFDSSFVSSEVDSYEDMSLDDYAGKVEYLIDEIKNGRLMQCVLSRCQGLSLRKHPLDSYSGLRDLNPSPYSFYLSFGGGEFLYGASPEVHIKVVDGKIEIRPIAGTIKRSENAFEDAKARIQLLNDKKERREHTMLVDLARHEIHRISYPESVRVTDMLTLESYPNLYHLVSGVVGRLRPEYDSLDGLLTTLPAGTLSGAPKVEAMKLIEDLEHSRRDFYGGAVGYFSFNGDCNTGITIRSVHVKDGMSFMRAGAGVVAHSTPAGEAGEIQLKSEKAMEVLR